MKSSRNKLLFIIFAVSQFARCSLSESPELEDVFAKDWIIEGKDTVAYSRNFNQHREFSYTSCDTSEDYCNVTIEITKPSDTSSKTCKFHLDRSETPEIGVNSLYLPEHNEQPGHVVVEWYHASSIHFDPFMDYLRIDDCKRDMSRYVGSIYNIRKPPHVLMYRNGLVAVAELRNLRRIVRQLSFDGWQGNDAQSGVITVDHSWTDEEQPVDMDSAKGFFFVAANGDSDTKMDVMSVDLESKNVTTLGSVERDNGHTYTSSSGSNRKYGLCWKKYKNEKQVNCTQFDIDGKKIMEQTNLELAESMDWFAIHNLKESAMLIISGQCKRQKCNEFSVTKVGTDSKKSAPFEIKNLDAECPEAPFSLSMDIVEDLENKLICFNFVCLNNKYKDQSVEKTSTTIQYRRNCVKEDVIANMDLNN